MQQGDGTQKPNKGNLKSSWARARNLPDFGVLEAVLMILPDTRRQEIKRSLALPKHFGGLSSRKKQRLTRRMKSVRLRGGLIQYFRKRRQGFFEFVNLLHRIRHSLLCVLELAL